MGLRGILVRFPAQPLDTLFPEERLAALAGLLFAQGQRFSVEAPVLMSPKSAAGADFFRAAAIEWLLRADPTNGGACVIRVVSFADEASAKILARAAHQVQPERPVFLWRDYPVRGSRPITLVTGQSRLTEKTRSAEKVLNSAARSVDQSMDAGIDAWCESIYPALSDGTKLPVWSVAQPSYADGARQAASLMQEMSERRGVCRFFVSGCAPFGNEAEALASELLSRRLHIRYAREVPVAATTPTMLAALRASGCDCLLFRIDSGSQRLLDEVYQRPFSVSLAERVIKTARCAGFYTIAEFDYPSPHDDRHTRAETLRFVERSRPHAVNFSGGVVDGGRFSRARLVGGIEALGVAKGVDPRLVLCAELSSDMQAPGVLAGELSTLTESGDGASLTGFVQRLNRRMLAGPQIPRYRPTEKGLFQRPKVVGN